MEKLFMRVARYIKKKIMSPTNPTLINTFSMKGDIKEKLSIRVWGVFMFP